MTQPSPVTRERIEAIRVGWSGNLFAAPGSQVYVMQANIRDLLAAIDERDARLKEAEGLLRKARTMLVSMKSNGPIELACRDAVLDELDAFLAGKGVGEKS